MTGAWPAPERGAWDDTKTLIEKGQDWIVTEMRDPACAGAAALGSRPA